MILPTELRFKGGSDWEQSQIFKVGGKYKAVLFGTPEIGLPPFFSFYFLFPIYRDFADFT